MSGGEIFGYGWREDHARVGDVWLRRAEHAQDIAASRGDDHAMQGAASIVSGMAAIAQAHYAAANVRARPIRDAELPSEIVFSSEPEKSFTTGPYREGGCPVARFDHASAPYGPQCERPQGHPGDHMFPA